MESFQDHAKYIDNTSKNLHSKNMKQAEERAKGLTEKNRLVNTGKKYI